ncbi:MAG: glycosyltransferase [Caulobacter sp.]|nr:glycosyltransferase [Caulobacter sp.]
MVTSQPAGAEPRAPRHAVAAKQAFPDAEVLFVDCAPRGATQPDPPDLRAAAGVIRQTLDYPSRASAPVALAISKLRVLAARWLMKVFGLVTEPLFGERTIGLTAMLIAARADVYMGHNIETLLPIGLAARRNRAALIFDCMEYYSDMGEDQSVEEARAATLLETRWLPQCVLTTASSEALSRVLASRYAITPPLALYNTPPAEELPPRPKAAGLRLYWRNAVVGFSQRGLDDALVALTLLPDDVTLHLQGKPSMDGGARLRARIAELGLVERVTILPPYSPGQAVRQAARYDVGLCLERRGPANHEYTVSNKLFDYMMAGLAVVIADLPSLRAVVDRADSGLIFEPGSPQALAAQIRRLRDEPGLLTSLMAKAGCFALTEGNLAADMERFRVALQCAVRAKAGNRTGEAPNSLTDPMGAVDPANPVGS